MQDLETKRENRLSMAGKIADLIYEREYEKAADLIRPKGAISAGSDYLPKAIGCFMDDRGLSDRITIVPLVESVIMGYYPKTIIPDMKSLRFNVNEQALNWASIGCNAYARALAADHCGVNYRIHGCPCCQSKDGKVYPLEKAKIGRTLPPFSKDCNAWVSME